MKRLLMMLAALGLVLSYGCEFEKWANSPEKEAAVTKDGEPEFKDDGKPHFVISINEIVRYPRAEQLEREIATFDGRSVWINTNPYIHTRYIREVTLLPDPEKKGFYKFKMTLNRRGRLIWMQLAVQFRGRPMAFLIDGVFYRAFVPPPLHDEDNGHVIIDGPFDMYTAKAVQRYSASNYKLFNPDEEEGDYTR